MPAYDHLSDLIEFENENSRCEFKKGQYPREQHAELLRDIVALANADITGDRFIIVGVKHLPDGSRTFHSIERSEFVDDATYQQLVGNNVEPEIRFEYFPYEFGGALFGIFRISDCIDPPYMIKKQYEGLRPGEAWVRKGSTKTRIVRRDIDRMFTRRESRDRFAGAVTIGFNVSDIPSELDISVPAAVDLPSVRAEKKIRDILGARERNDVISALSQLQAIGVGASIFGAAQPYERRTTDELKLDLAHVRETYSADDVYEMFEERGARINFAIRNDGPTYLNDAHFTAEIPSGKGLWVASRIHRRPRATGYPWDAVESVDVFAGRDYPSVELRESVYRIEQSLGDVKHQFVTTTFKEDVRAWVAPNTTDRVEIRCTLLARNLESPVRAKLILIPRAGIG